jgi:hypothetical protein
LPVAKRCPLCNRVMPLLATECLYCRPPVPAATPTDPGEEPRFSVIRRGLASRSGSGEGDTDQTRLPLMRENEAAWYCRIGGQIIGPVTAFAIRDAFSKGQIDSEASIGVRGQKDWFPIRSLPQFADLVTQPAIPVPLPTSAAVGAAGSTASRPVESLPPEPRVVVSPAAMPAPHPPRGGDGPAAPAGRPATTAAREDATLIVSPLPPPTFGSPPDASNGTSAPNALQVWQSEVKRLRRRVALLAITSGGLLVLALTFLGLWLSRR